MKRQKTHVMVCPHCKVPMRYVGKQNWVGFMVNDTPLHVACPRCGREYRANLTLGKDPASYTTSLVEVKPCR